MKNLTPWKKGSDVKVTQVPSYEDSLLPSLGRPFDEMFRSFFGDDLDSFWEGSRLPSLLERDADLAPSLDIVETDKAYKISAELPGMDEKDVEVLVEGNTLRLRGEKKHEEETEEEGYHVMERSYGHFERVVPLPEGTDLENIGARFKKGVLKIELPKTEKAKQSRRVVDVTSE